MYLKKDQKEMQNAKKTRGGIAYVDVMSYYKSEARFLIEAK